MAKTYFGSLFPKVMSKFFESVEKTDVLIPLSEEKKFISDKEP
jgi:hypothetical protein